MSERGPNEQESTGRETRVTKTQLLITTIISESFVRILLATLDTVRVRQQLNHFDGSLFAELLLGFDAIKELTWSQIFLVSFPTLHVIHTTIFALRNPLSAYLIRRSRSRFWALSYFLSSVMTTFLVYPYIVAKTRVQMNPDIYTSVLHIFWGIISVGGISALWSGFLLNVVEIAIQSIFIRFFRTRYVAPITSYVVTFPFFTIKTIKQVYPSMSITEIMTERGFSGLFGGFLFAALKLGPSVFIGWVVREICVRALIWWNGYTTDPFRTKPKAGINQRLSPEEMRIYLRDINKKID